MALEKNLLGVVHPVLFTGPGNTGSVLRGEGRKEYVVKSLQWIVDDPDFRSVEITRFKSPAIRKEVNALLQKARQDQKLQEIVYTAQLVQIINEDNIVEPSDICSLDENERVKAVSRLKECMDEAQEYGCDKFAFYSGKNPAILQGLSGEAGERISEEALSQLRRSVYEICSYLKEIAGTQTPMRPVMEIFDSRTNIPGTSFFKEALIGSSDRAERLVESVRHYYGHHEFGLMIDASHMLISGEGPEIIKKLTPYLAHVHIANVVLNRNTPEGDARYGDAHPALNVPDSELTADVLAGYLHALNEVQYAGTLSFEIKPIGSEIPEDIAQSAKAFYFACRNRIDVNYALPRNYIFQSRRFLTDDLWDRLSDLRVRKPGLVEERMLKRKQRSTIAPNGKLVVLAADHPARMVTNVGDDPVAMGNRFDYLGRCARVLMASPVDGIMATADVIEDLVFLDSIYEEKCGVSFLDERILIACMNRSGLAGAKYELMDRMTAYRDVKKIKKLNLDGAKLLMRLAIPDPYDRYALQTMEECARCIEASHEAQLPVFLEPLPVKNVDGKYQVIMEADALIRIIGVASGLSHSSSNVWLKIPYVSQFNRVVQAFSGPILMLGGESKGSPVAMIEQFERGMGEGENVRGALVGRNVLYPGDDDPAATAAAVCAIVNEGLTANEAVKLMAEFRGGHMDLLPKA